MIRFVLLLSRQGKVRLAKWYTTYTQKERAKIIRDISPLVLGRALKLCNFLDYQDSKVVYKRYASLYFVVGMDATDNELITLEIIHQYVEVLDRYFGNVCELDLIFNFHKAYFMLDEMLLAGQLQEPSKKAVAKAIEMQDKLVEEAKANGSLVETALGTQEY
jgi:AP-1 complex subunit sigma 1/2